MTAAQPQEIVIRLVLDIAPPAQPAADCAAPQLHTVAEAAEILRVGKSTVAELIAAGRLTSMKMGASRRISRAAIAAYIREHEDGGADAA